MRVTGERVTGSKGGFNPTWQRHIAAYVLCEPFLPSGPVLDLGCGIGHSYRRLAPRRTVGVDVAPDPLRNQSRDTVAADMRALPFAAASFDSLISVQSIEHVPDPERAMAETVRVLRRGGAAVWVTPNRLTFARADEVIDPYHYVEYDPAELEALCRRFFGEVELHGVFGTPRYLELVAEEQRKLDALLRLDPLRLRRLVPRRARQRLYDWCLTLARRHEDPRAAAITFDDFTLGPADSSALDLVAVTRLV